MADKEERNGNENMGSCNGDPDNCRLCRSARPFRVQAHDPNRREGDFEARSIGSFSVRLYEAAAAPDETTFFISGLIRARDGVVEKVMLADIDEDQQQEIVVTVRSVGTGSYLSAHAFSVAKGKLAFRTAVEGLASNSDPVAALRKADKKQE